MRKSFTQSFRFIDASPNKMVFLEPLGKQHMINLSHVVQVRRVDWSLEFVLRNQKQECKIITILYPSSHKADKAYEVLKESIQN
jgi:hypothetical protein